MNVMFEEKGWDGMELKRVALVGLGGIGAFVAPRLHKTLGEGFYVVAEGERRERLSRGVTINGAVYRFPIRTPEELERADLVIFATKNMHLGQAMEDAAGAVGEGTVVLSLLNGIDSEERLAEAYPHAHVLKALIRVPATNQGGVITVPMERGRITFGEDRNTVLTPQVAAVQELLTAAGILWDTPEDMVRAQWLKYMANVSENQIAAVLGLTYGDFQASESARFLCRQVCLEVLAVGVAHGVDLREADVEEREPYLMSLRPEGKPSTLQDMEAGRPTEVETFSGRIMALAGEKGVAVPYCTFLYHGIKTLEGKEKR